MPYGRLAASVTLDKYEAHHTLERLRRHEGPLLRGLHDKVFKAWQLRGVHQHITVPLTHNELRVMRRLGASSSPQVIRYKWFAIYLNGTTEVFTQTTLKPPKKKTLRVAGRGRKKFTLQRVYKLPMNSKESADFMARKKAAVKEPEDEIDELEGLEELDEEEPDVEEDEDEVEEKPRRRKKSAAKTTTRKRTRKKAVVEEEDDEEEDEDDEDEEEEPAPKKRRTRSKSSVKSAKSNGKGTKKGASAAGRSTKELTGGVGTAELAEAASEIADMDIDGRDVRVYLRKNEVEKNEEHGRYYWKSTGSPQFKKLAKLIAKEYGDE